MNEGNHTMTRGASPRFVRGAEREIEPSRYGETAQEMARRVCEGFRCHDEGDREGAIEAFHYVDSHQFDHLTDEQAREAAAAFVEALWRKDEIEEPYVSDGVVADASGLKAADWSPVESALARRARIVGMNELYATLTMRAWKRHKTDGDYWTPTLEAQRLECKAALGTTRYPEKERAGRAGPGALPARYLVAVELHDARTEATWNRAVDVMTPYYAAILGSGDLA